MCPDFRWCWRFPAEYTQLNTFAQVPTLEVDETTLITQSLAIMEYLEEAFPAQPMLPVNTLTQNHGGKLLPGVRVFGCACKQQSPLERAFVRQFAENINSGIQVY